MSMVTTASWISSSRASRRVRVARDDDETARADGQTRAPRAALVVAAMDGGGGSGSLANEVRARACIFGSSLARGRRGDRGEAAIAGGVDRGWRPARARARDGAWGNLMGSSYPSGLRAKRGRRTRGDSCGTEGWW